MKQKAPSLAVLRALGIEVDEEAYLAHYGVKGMRWGVRKRRDTIHRARKKGRAEVRKQRDNIYNYEVRTGKMASKKDYAKLDAAKKAKRTGVRKAKASVRNSRMSPEARAVKAQRDKIFAKEMKTGKMASKKDYAKLDAAKAAKKGARKKAKAAARKNKAEYKKSADKLFAKDWMTVQKANSKYGMFSKEARAVQRAFDKRYAFKSINDPGVQAAVKSGKGILEG
jgi:hypothetical protein